MKEVDIKASTLLGRAIEGRNIDWASLFRRVYEMEDEVYVLKSGVMLNKTLYKFYLRRMNNKK